MTSSKWLFGLARWAWNDGEGAGSELETLLTSTPCEPAALDGAREDCHA